MPLNRILRAFSQAGTHTPAQRRGLWACMLSGPPVLRMLVLVAVMLQAAVSQAQIRTAITSSGLGTTVAPPPAGGTVYQITGGTRQRTNLFHSFGLFSVGTGDTASFQNTTPALTTTNILGRVTGGERSIVNGTIDALSYPGANLFLINPAGVLFGPNASLNVGGSFHVATADYVRFADGAKFYANLAQNSVLTLARPEAFGFLGPTPAPLIVQGSSLQVQSGTLSLVGGDVTVQAPGALSAPNGRLQLVAVGSAGEVQLNAPDGTPNLKLVGFSSLGQVDLSQVPVLAGDTVLIRGSLVAAICSSASFSCYAACQRLPRVEDTTSAGEPDARG